VEWRTNRSVGVCYLSHVRKSSYKVQAGELREDLLSSWFSLINCHGVLDHVDSTIHIITLLKASDSASSRG
jgi:hypothetical protein